MSGPKTKEEAKKSIFDQFRSYLGDVVRYDPSRADKVKQIEDYYKYGKDAQGRHDMAQGQWTLMEWDDLISPSFDDVIQWFDAIDTYGVGELSLCKADYSNLETRQWQERKRVISELYTKMIRVKIIDNILRGVGPSYGASI